MRQAINQLYLEAALEERFDIIKDLTSTAAAPYLFTHDLLCIYTGTDFFDRFDSDYIHAEALRCAIRLNNLPVAKYLYSRNDELIVVAEKVELPSLEMAQVFGVYRLIDAVKSDDVEYVKIALNEKPGFTDFLNAIPHIRSLDVLFLIEDNFPNHNMDGALSTLTSPLHPHYDAAAKLAGHLLFNKTISDSHVRGIAKATSHKWIGEIMNEYLNEFELAKSTRKTYALRQMECGSKEYINYMFYKYGEEEIIRFVNAERDTRNYLMNFTKYPDLNDFVLQFDKPASSLIHYAIKNDNAPLLSHALQEYKGEINLETVTLDKADIIKVLVEHGYSLEFDSPEFLSGAVDTIMSLHDQYRDQLRVSQ